MKEMKLIFIIAIALVIAYFTIHFIFYIIPIFIVLFLAHIIYRNYFFKNKLKTYNKKTTLKF